MPDLPILKKLIVFSSTPENQIRIDVLSCLGSLHAAMLMEKSRT